MNRTTISLLVAGLFVVAPSAFAQLKFSGTVTGGVQGTDISSRNDFRLQEYRDLDSSVLLGTDIKGETDIYHFRLFSENIGQDDQFIEFKGGRYGLFKYSLYNNNIIHNLTFGAVAPYTGIGSNVLGFPFASAAAAAAAGTAAWIPFDYSVKHKNYGGTFELQSSLGSPFYFRATANKKDTTGIRPNGAAGTSPGGPAFELPAPVDYTTTDFSAEGGYTTKSSQFSVNLSYSKFQDHNDFLNWRNPFITAGTTTERTSLAADNDLWKLALNAMLKQLPMNSTLALRGTYSKLTNSLPVEQTYISVVGTTGNLRRSNPSRSVFDGDIVNKTLSASLTSQLARAFDSRLYWNWSEKDNNSTRIVFTPVVAGNPGTGGNCDINPATGTTTGTTTCTTELFHYKKNNLGVDLQYRFNRENKLSGGYDYANTERERIDFNETTDHKFYAEWKNTTFDLLGGRIKYQYLNRDSHFQLGNDPNVFSRFLYRFDVAPLDQHLVKLVLNSDPAPFLDLGAELIYKKNQYKDVFLGRTKDDRQELYLTASYGDPKKFRITGFFDAEHTHYSSTHQQGNPGSVPASTSSTVFIWNGKVHDKSHIVGIGADWPFSERLKFIGSLIWQETNGAVDFSVVNNFVVPINSGAYDSFRKDTLNLKAVLTVEKNFDIALGYAYEKFRYADAQMDGYNYRQLTGANQNLLTGAYAFPNYRAHIGYLTLTYKFK
jgi:MtrB/PioB family decaheme-associated outer membrane protein